MILTLMLVGAISLFSLANKNTIYYGNRCHSTLNENSINYLNSDEIIAYDYELNCNTLYLDLNVKDELTKDQIIAVLINISQYYKTINHNIDTQVTIKNANYLILASIIKDGTVSLSVSEL